MKIFLSYRRSDSDHVVDRVYLELLNHFGKERVFRDIHDIPIAVDYRSTLQAALKQCNVLVALIGERWLSAVDDQGRRRLDVPDDWVRQEIETALIRKIHVVPVILDAAGCPDSRSLPESISLLAFQQCHRLRTDEAFELDMTGLIRGIEELGPLLGSEDSTLTFELKSDKEWKLEQRNVWEAHEINCAIVDCVKEIPLRVVSWQGEPFRVVIESSSAGYRAVLEKFLSGKLDKVTKVHWVSCELVDTDEALAIPIQTPIFDSKTSVNSNHDRSLVCVADLIVGFEHEWLESQQFVGDSTSNPREFRAYVTRGTNGDLYIHSNFIKRGFERPTKIQTNNNVDLLTLFANLTMASDSHFQLQHSLEELHQHHARYYVNEKAIPKGNIDFFCGATHVQFVRPDRVISPMDVWLNRLDRMLSSWKFYVGVDVVIAAVTYSIYRKGLALFLFLLCFVNLAILGVAYLLDVWKSRRREKIEMDIAKYRIVRRNNDY